MAASITASPNPVGFWSPSDKRTTTISWDTGGAGHGYVNVTLDVGPEQPFDVGANTGKHSKDFSTPDLALGHSYTFTLHREDNDKVLAKVAVTTEDLEQRLLDQTSEWAMQQRAMGGAPQAVTDLTVAAGVDTVRISFRTVQPTIPSVTVTAADGTQVASWLPLFGGLQTQHECILGRNIPLDQQTSYRLRIVASGSYFGKPHDAVVTQTFTTGSRKVTLFFDSINVRKDGDPAGAGEFEFYFRAGDSDGGAQLGYAVWGEGDISDEDPPVDVDAVPDQFVDLGEKRLGIDDHAVADHAHHAVVEDARRNQVQHELLAADVDRVAGVVAALVTRHPLEARRHQIDDLALALVSPLRPEHRDVHNCSILPF